MTNRRTKTYLRQTFMLLGIATLVIACQKDNFNEEKGIGTSMEEHPISIKSISITEAGEIFKALEQKYKLDRYMGKSQNGNTQQRNAVGDSTGIIIYTDVVKEITQGDYTSYTMYIETQQDKPVQTIPR